MQQVRTLPTIDILGTRFFIEVRLRQITNSQAPYNSIRFRDMEYGPDRESYRFWIDKETKEQFVPDKNIAAFPPDIVCVEIPEERKLDPVGMKLHFGTFDSWLNDVPVIMLHTAKFIPRKQTGLHHFLSKRQQPRVLKQDNSAKRKK